MLLSYLSGHTRECPPSSCHWSRRTLSSIRGSWTARTSKTPADTITFAADSTIGISVLTWSPSVPLCVQVYYHGGGPNTVQISVFDALCRCIDELGGTKSLMHIPVFACPHRILQSILRQWPPALDSIHLPQSVSRTPLTPPQPVWKWFSACHS